MAWETRGKSIYYYRKKRRGRRVVSRYVGPGLVGLFSEAFDREKGDLARAERIRRTRESRSWETVDAAVASFSRLLQGRADQALGLLGYRYHNGIWRRRRMKHKSPTNAIAGSEAAEALAAAAAQAGRPDATTEDARRFADLLLAHPDEARRYCGDPAKEICFYLAKAACPNQASRAVLMAEFDITRRRLDYEQSSPLEQVVIDLVALNGCHLKVVSGMYVVAMGYPLKTRDRRAWEGILSASQGRYDRALRTLAQMRRALGVPNIRINVVADGGRQLIANVNAPLPITAGQPLPHRPTSPPAFDCEPPTPPSG